LIRVIRGSFFSGTKQTIHELHELTRTTVLD
jgi:hypothetical protein